MIDSREAYALYLEAAESKGATSAVEKLKSAADEGNPFAQNYYGIILRDGTNVNRNRAEAARYFAKASEYGIDESQFHLGLLKLNGDSIEKNLREAYKLFRISATKGYAPAQYYLAMCYKEGIVCYRDERYANMWFKRAADNGYSKAYLMLGDISNDIHSPMRDRKAALNFYLHAIESGETEGFYKAGMCYLEGDGGEISRAEAVKCFEEGKKNGDCECEFMLGLIQLKDGIETEKAQAAIHHAAIMGSKAAKEYLDSLSSQKKTAEEPATIGVNRPDTPDVIGRFKGVTKKKK